MHADITRVTGGHCGGRGRDSGKRGASIVGCLGINTGAHTTNIRARQINGDQQGDSILLSSLFEARGCFSPFQAAYLDPHTFLAWILPSPSLFEV